MKIFSREDLKNINGGAIHTLVWTGVAGLFGYASYLSIRYKQKNYK